MSLLETRIGSDARTFRLFKDPKILRILVMCSDEMLDATAPVFMRLFLRSVMVSIMNFVRTDKDDSPIRATAG